MKFTLGWLKEHLQTDAPIVQISEKLTALGLEVEELTDPAAAIAGFTVAEILEATQHPNADKLRVCIVATDTGELQIVCGAPNARAGIKVVLAKVGALIPNGQFTIKRSAIRGVESCGMLCSANELNLGGDSDGIIELPLDAPIGAAVADVLGLNDPVIDIAITPDRGDCLGVYGIARDLAAAGLGSLKPIPAASYAPSGPCPIGITLETPHCRQFVGVLVRNVTNGPSPEWLQQRLKAIGLRPISALVDITNYFTFTYGRPLHVFDADKLSGTVRARDAVAGESFDALNDKSYTLQGGECVIADDSGMLGLGGVVGGTSTGVTDATRNVFLECAWFEPAHIAQNGRLHGVESDARYRFERGVDPAFVQTGAVLATQMIIDLCGGEASELQIAGHIAANETPLTIDANAVNQLAGTAITSAEQQRILSALGFAVTPSSGACYQAVAPSWRPDMVQLADIAEEILRIHGYDRVEAVSLPKHAAVSRPALSAVQKRDQQIRRHLAQHGLMECHHWAFMSDRKAALFAPNSPDLMLQNPISADLNIMRPSLLPHLMDAAARNMARGNQSIALFEVGPIFTGIAPADQRPVAACLRGGLSHLPHWQEKPHMAAALDAKADALAILSMAGMDTDKLSITRDAPDYYHPGRSGVLRLGPKNILGYFGELHPLTLQAMDCSGAMAACELFLDMIPQPKSKAPQPLILSDFPWVERDFAFILDETIEAETLIKALKNINKQLVQHVRLFDLYAGKGIEPGKRSLALTIRLQSTERTLTEDEINAVSDQAVKAAAALGAVLRG